MCIPCWNICFTFGLCDFTSLTNSICQLVENSILEQWKAANKLAHRSHILTKLKTLNINLKSCKTRGILKRGYCQLCCAVGLQYQFQPLAVNITHCTFKFKCIVILEPHLLYSVDCEIEISNSILCEALYCLMKQQYQGGGAKQRFSCN